MAVIIKKREAGGYSEQDVYILLSVHDSAVFACDRNGRVFSVPDPGDYEVASIDGRTPTEIIEDNTELGH